MDDTVKNKETQPLTQQPSTNIQEENEDSENETDFDHIEISEEQIIEQDSFYNQFAEFSPSKNPQFLSKDYEFRLINNIQLKSSLFQYMYNFYKNQHQNAEKIKDKVLLRLHDFQYSMNHLSIISNFFQSYTSFQNFCISAQLILSNQTFPNPPYQIFERTIMLNILDTNRSLTLKNLLYKFKHFPLIRRKEILTIAVERFLFSIKREDTSIPILTKSKERVTSELARLSGHLGITYDIESYDGQHFLYACETLLSEYQRLHFSFNIVSDCQPQPKKLVERINSSFMETFSKDDSISEAFYNIINPNDGYTSNLVDALNIKKFPRELIVSWVSLRFCRNRQLLSKIEKSTTKLFQCKKKIYDICKIELNHDDRTFCDKYISFMIEQILAFSSAVFLSSGKKADFDPLIEISLEKFLLFTDAKIKILSLFAEISKHSSSEKVIELTNTVIEKRPNLIFQHFSFFDHFDTQIETLEKVVNCLSIIVNIQILNERQITSFYGNYFEPFQFGTFYSNEGEGEFNISKFEIYLYIEKVLDFISIAPKIVDEICSTMSIKAIDYSVYVELAVWTQLLNEIGQFPEVSIFGTNFSTIRFNLPISKDVESLINCQLLDDPLFLKNFEEKVETSTTVTKSKFTENLIDFCLLAFKLRSLIYKTNLYLSLYNQQYEEFYSKSGPNKAIEFISKTFDFSNYDEIQKLCLSGDFSDIVEIVNCQKRFNIMLMIAIQHNNFRSDNEIISILFQMTKPDSLFNFTKAETEAEEDMKFYQDAAKRFFVGFDSFFDQDFGRIFLDITEITDFKDVSNLMSKLKKYINRIELATITNYERIILHDFQQIELFSLDREFFKKEEGIVDYFSIPGFSQCLQIDCEDDQFDEILKLISTRLQLISFIRFNSFFKISKKNPFIFLYNRKFHFESTFLSKLNSASLMKIEDAFNIINSECIYEMGRFQLSILQRLSKFFTSSKKDSSEKVNSLTVDEVRNFWKLVNQEYDIKNNNGPKLMFNNVLIERYIPIFLSCLNFTFSEALKNDLLDQIDDIKKQIVQNIVFKDPQNPEYELRDYVKFEIVNELLKFALLRLHTNVTFSDLNVLSLVDITRSEYKENLHFFTNFFIVPGASRLPKVIENNLLKQPIDQIVVATQKKQNIKKNEDQHEQLKIFDSVNSLLKPDIYIKKTKFEHQKLQPYNPTPENAKIQFDQEMRFANSKIVSLLIQSINQSIISDKVMIFNTNSKIDLNFDPNLLASKMAPLSYYLYNFVERSQPQILKTWLSYTEIMKQITFAYDQGEILERLFKKKFHITLGFQLGSKYFNDFIKLAKLREIEKATDKEQKIFQIESEKQIRNEFENELNELLKEKQELMKQYKIIHDKLFGLSKNVIQKQKDKIPENEKIIQPTNEEAKKSLEISKKEGFTLEVDDNLRNEVFSSSSEVEEEKKKNEEEEQEEFPTFNFKNTARDDSNVVEAFPTFSIQPPPRLMNNNRNQIRRNTMIRPGARALLLARQNFEQQQEEKKEKEREEKESKSPMNEIKRHVEKSKEKSKEIEKELPDLKKMILKLRITRCLFRIATNKQFKKGENSLTRERKEASTMFLSNRKLFEEDLRVMQNKIDQCCQRLLKAEIDSENLRNDLNEQKKITTKLAHWKELNLKTSDEILKKIELYEKGPNIDVNQLIKKLDHKRAELDALYMDEESFETDLYYKITQPLQEISRVRRFVQSEQYNALKMQQTSKSQDLDDSLNDEQNYDVFDENLKLKMENKRLREQIELLEKKEEPQLPPIQIDNSKQSFELPQLPTTRRVKTSRSTYASPRGRTQIRPRSLYSNYGYRTIRRP